MTTRPGAALLPSVLLALSLVGCGPGATARKVGESWTTRQVGVVTEPTDAPMSSPNVNVFFVESLDAEGTARVSLYKEDHGGFGLALLVDATGQVVGVTGSVLCRYEKPYGFAPPRSDVGAKWSLDNTVTCDPGDPGIITGSAEVVARETLDTAFGSLEVLKISATRRTARKQYTYDETVTLHWSTALDLEVKNHSEWVNTSPEAGNSSRGTSDMDLVAHAPAK